MRKRASIALKASALALVLALLAPVSARAQFILCEDPSDAQTDMKGLASDAIDMFGDLITELAIFIDNDIGKTAKAEMLDRLDQYNTNLYPPLDEWWNVPADMGPYDAKKFPKGNQKGYNNKNAAIIQSSVKDPTYTSLFKDGDCSDNDWDKNPDCIDGAHPPQATLPAWKAMVRQLSIAKIDQTRQIGSLVDARLINEHLMAKVQTALEARERFTPGEGACQMDIAGPAMNKMYYMSRALTRTITREDTLRRLNYLQPQPEVADSGGTLIKAAYAVPPRNTWGMDELRRRFKIYSQLYCDPELGDPGCDKAYIAANPDRADVGMDVDIPSMLFGDRQTIDFTDSKKQDTVLFALQTLIDPFAPDPIAKNVLGNMTGIQAFSQRRAYNVRVNSIYNVMAQMISERAAIPTDKALGGKDGAGAAVDAPKDAETGLPLDPTADANKALGFDPVDNPHPDDGMTSYASLRNALAKSRYLDPAYVTRIVVDPTAAAQEQSNVNAAQAQLLNDLLKRNEEMLFMESMSYSDDLDATMPASALAATPTGG
jgi:hypothetical protein